MPRRAEPTRERDSHPLAWRRSPPSPRFRHRAVVAQGVQHEQGIGQARA